MAVLAALCQRAGELVGADDLLDACWLGEAVGSNPMHKAIAALRRAFGDNTRDPRYIITIRKRGYQLNAPVRWLSGEGPRSSRGAWRGQSPFRGLEPFGQAHASVFFGRDGAVADLHARLTSRWQDGEPLVVLLGPSGSGKTSLVQAGLMPALLAPAEGSARLRVCAVAMADLGALSALGPWACLAGALLDWEADWGQLISGYSIEALAHVLLERPEEILNQLRISLAAGRSSSPMTADPPLLVLDRLEALLDGEAGPRTMAFLRCLDVLVCSRVVLVLVICRNDFYPELAKHPVLLRGKSRGAHMDLGAPDPEELAQIVRLPAQAAGLVYGTDDSGMHRLDDRLCADAMHAHDALPLLQYTLQSLYLGRAPGNELTWACYDDMGGLEGAIGSRADEVLAALPSAQQLAAARVLPRLMSLSSEDALPVARWLGAAELQDEDERALVQALVEARLLVADRNGTVAGYRVVHESLLRKWPRVVNLVAELRAHLAVRHELSSWLQRWTQSGRANNLLLPDGALLARASKSVADAPNLFGDEERSFVDRANRQVRWQGRARWAGFMGVVGLALLAVTVALRNADLAEVSAARELQSRRLITFMLGDLVDQLRPIGKLDLLSRIGEQGVSLLSVDGLPKESAADVLQRAKALVVIGEVNSSRGKGLVHVAVTALEEARRLLLPLEHAPGLRPGDFYATLGASEFWMGQIAFDAGDVEGATRAMERYRDACERWRRVAPQDTAAAAELGFALNSLGSIAVRRGAWTDARRWMEQSLALKLSMLAAHPDDIAALDAVASSRTWLAQVAHVRGDLREALAQIEAARDIQQALIKRAPGEVVRLHDFGVLRVRQAEVLQGLGRHAQALQSLESAVALLTRAVAAAPDNVHWSAEIRHAEAALLLARVDAGTASEAQVQSMRSRMLSEPPDGAIVSEFLWRAAFARIDAAGVMLAARRVDWGAAQGADTEARRRLQALRQVRANDWQLLELQARLDMLRMARLQTQRMAQAHLEACRQTVSELQPAVDAGQAGFVLEIWLMASKCAGVAIDELTWLGRLTAGAYQPVTPVLLNSLTTSRRSRND